MSGHADRPLFERLVHDLKGPLSPLQTAAYLLRRPEVPEERRTELVETIERQARRLGGMIEELGDWVRAREGRILPRSRPFDLAIAIDLAVGAVPGCVVDPELAPGVEEARVVGDDGRLVQALASLLTFAQSRDGDTLRLRAWVDGANARIEVADAGPPVGDVEALLADPLAEPYDLGLGLRLVIAREVVLAHGGSLVARDAGPGLAFTVTLPLAPDA